MRLVATKRGTVRIQRYAVFAAVCLAAAVGALVSPGVALAAGSCGTGLTGAGYYESGTPAVDHSVSAEVRPASGDHVYSGDIRGQLKLRIGTSGYPNDLLYVGIIDQGGSPQIYFEDDGTFEGQWAASYDTYYTVSISHDGANQYTLHWGSHSFTAITYNDGSANRTNFYGIDNYAGTTNNLFEYIFNGLSSPYLLNDPGMTACTSGSPYSDTTQSGVYTGFETGDAN